MDLNPSAINSTLKLDGEIEQQLLMVVIVILSPLDQSLLAKFQVSDPSFERFHFGNCYALNFETGIFGDFANNCNYRPILDVIFQYFSNFFL